MKTYILSILVCITHLTFGQTLYSRNFHNPEYGILSYIPTSNTLLVPGEKGQLLLKSPNAEKSINGNIGLITPSGNSIISITYGHDTSTIHIYDLSGKLLKEKSIHYPIIDIATDASEKYIYALSGNLSALNEFPVYTYYEPGVPTSNLLQLDCDLQLLNVLDTYLPKGNATSFAVLPNLDQIIVAGGLQGTILNLNGDSITTFKTIHASFVKVNSNKLYSILHEFGDGSYLDIFKSKNDTISISKELHKKYRLNPHVKTSISVFKSWDINHKSSHILTLDHSNSISIVEPSGSIVKTIKHKANSIFVFFINDETIGVYDNKYKKITTYNIFK
jgi:hypothetical protein